MEQNILDKWDVFQGLLHTHVVTDNFFERSQSTLVDKEQMLSTVGTTIVYHLWFLIVQSS